ncbi:hypothetical protein I79_024109 [Cricetulus griseus]|uniref:Uncharacterized protein n=1 Tax=Cricetulus griseus TaxID=10029 RepID=G3IJS3_CRIGR|nr:hypothetical protein I79_024109 [Cricetulus griseus]
MPKPHPEFTCTRPAHLLIHTGHEECKYKDGRHGRRQVAGDRLDVVEELPTLRRLHHREPSH